MAFIHAADIGWHEGEVRMGEVMHNPPRGENPTSPFLTPGAAYLVQASPLLALGTLDKDGRPWTTLLGGQRGFARPIGASIIGLRIMVDSKFDPVVDTLVGGGGDGEVIKADGQGRAISGLAIDLGKRQRVKLAGHMVAGALGQVDVDGHAATGVSEMQLVVKVDRSLGNCPKYLNKKEISPSTLEPKLLSSTTQLPRRALDLLEAADLFFITTSVFGEHMSTNIRGGTPGFVRVLTNTPDSTTLVFPEYSGNRLYQSLGNLQLNPLAGIVIPNLETGDVLYLTGRTSILVGKDAAAIIPHSNLAVKLDVVAARFVEKGISFRAKSGEFSPYNPPVRYLATERPSGPDTDATTARLVKKELLTPTIARFRFKLSSKDHSLHWTRGQYAALAFEEELSQGYSHMRDEDPRSLNDDWVRTFTVSSSPDTAVSGLNEDEFEMTIRNVGPATGLLFRTNERAHLGLPVRGFGGGFEVVQEENMKTGFVAGGIGITPLLGQLDALDIQRLLLFWAIKTEDLGLVCDAIARTPSLGKAIQLFISNPKLVGKQDLKRIKEIEAAGSIVEMRRLQAEDLQVEGMSQKWYICTGPALKSHLLQWLIGKEVVYESFDY